MTDSRIGQVKYLGNILKTDVVQYKPLPHDAFSFGRVETLLVQT